MTPRYRVVLADNRTFDTRARNPVAAINQAAHQETTRVAILAKRGLPIVPMASGPVNAYLLKRVNGQWIPADA